MGRSTYLNVATARTQEAYYAKIQAAVFAWRTGRPLVLCPRAGCGQPITASRHGQMLTVQCPACGLIFRGNEDRLMSYYEPD